MNKQELFNLIKKKRSFLCVGLDSEFSKIPKHLLTGDDPVFEFNKKIIDATIEFTVAFKPNLAFYESLGTAGWISLEKTINYLKTFGNEVFTIADAKRGDIGNTSRLYATTFFEKLGFDAVTVAPYMGEDSVTPFLTYPGKFTIILALTSNKGASDFQLSQPKLVQTLNKFGIKPSQFQKLFEQVLLKSKEWGSDENMMYVVGATKAEMLKKIRTIVPDHFLLVPGVGAQGGSLQDVSRYGLNSSCGILVNASRSIIFASSDTDFDKKAKVEARLLQQEMENILIQYNLINA